MLEASAQTPQIGDRVGTRRDVLAEVARGTRSPRAWQLVPAGSTGKIVGWLDPDRAAISFDGMVFLVRVASVTRL
jgi:hypothetical protein